MNRDSEIAATRPDPMTRLAEIRANNYQGDVSAQDIAWLLDVAEAAVWLTSSPFGSIRERHFYKTREVLDRGE